MYCTRKIIKDVYYVGCDDYKINLFESTLNINHGVSYNSYIILDNKTCLLDTVDQDVSRQFFENVEHVLNGRELDYLVVHHMEPDHCYNIGEVLLRYPNVKVVSNEMVFKFISNFFPTLNLEGRKVVVKEGDTLDLGKNKLHFVFTPMVHWPEVMMSLEETNGILFSADAFGSFNTLDGNLYSSDVNYQKDFLDDARNYYTNIVGKYGSQVQAAFKKLDVSKIKMILPLHGLLWKGKDINFILDKYIKWSAYTPEDKEVIILFASMYGDNNEVARVLATKLSERGIKHLKVYDTSRTNVSHLVGESFRVSNIVLISPTYNMSIFPSVLAYLDDIMRMNLSSRTFTLIGNGSWAPVTNKLVKEKLSANPTIQFTPTELTITSSLKENELEIIDKIASEIKESLK